MNNPISSTTCTVLTTSNNYHTTTIGSGSVNYTSSETPNLILKNLILIDDVTGVKWEVRISNGQLIIEPHELADKRSHRINHILKNGDTL